MVDKRRQGRNNKARGKAYERSVAVRLGVERYAADTGGPIDIRTPGGLAIQVRSGLAVVTTVMRSALDTARKGAQNGEIPTVVLIDRRVRPLGEWLCFPLDEAIEFFKLKVPVTGGMDDEAPNKPEPTDVRPG